MLDFLELEETVGRAWHRLVGSAASYPRHPVEAVKLHEMGTMLVIYFRGVGGEWGVQLAGAAPRASRHRLSIRQYRGQSDERMTQPGRDGATLFLPTQIDLFQSRGLNEKPYLLLAACFAEVPLSPIAEADSLRAGLLRLRCAKETVQAALETCPGLAPAYAELCAALRGLRPVRKPPRAEARMEALVQAMLEPGGKVPDLWGPMSEVPVGYQPFLLVHLQGDSWTRPDSAEKGQGDEPAPGNTLAASDTRKRLATRRKEEGQQQRDPFILNCFEKIFIS